MSISIYTGAVGSGKSYHALVTGLRKINAIPLRFVIANFPITWSKKEKKRIKEMERWHFWTEITPEKLIAFSIEKGFYGQEGHCLLIIDEAGVMFNTRDWQSRARERANWINFMSQSRKFGYDIIMITQSDKMIDKQIRALAEYEVRHMAMRQYMWLKWLPIRLHVAVTFWYHTRFRGVLDSFIISKRIARRYDTMRIFNPHEMRSAVESLYEGKVVPAKVKSFLDEITAKSEAEKRDAGSTLEEGPAPREVPSASHPQYSPPPSVWDKIGGQEDEKSGEKEDAPEAVEA